MGVARAEAADEVTSVIDLADSALLHAAIPSINSSSNGWRAVAVASRSSIHRRVALKLLVRHAVHVHSVYLTGRSVYIHTPLPVGHAVYAQCVYLIGRQATGHWGVDCDSRVAIIDIIFNSRVSTWPISAASSLDRHNRYAYGVPYREHQLLLDRNELHFENQCRPTGDFGLPRAFPCERRSICTVCILQGTLAHRRATLPVA